MQKDVKVSYFILGCDAQCLFMYSIYFIAQGSVTEHPHEKVHP